MAAFKYGSAMSEACNWFVIFLAGGAICRIAILIRSVSRVIPLKGGGADFNSASALSVSPAVNIPSTDQMDFRTCKLRNAIKYIADHAVTTHCMELEAFGEASASLRVELPSQ